MTTLTPGQYTQIGNAGTTVSIDFRGNIGIIQAAAQPSASADPDQRHHYGSKPSITLTANLWAKPLGDSPQDLAVIVATTHSS
ncbi:MAG: hypothetical protein AAF394_05590 [Planctomycetota bacterium]